MELSVPRVNLEDLRLRHDLAAVAKNTDCHLLSELLRTVGGFIISTSSVTSPVIKHVITYRR